MRLIRLMRVYEVDEVDEVYEVDGVYEVDEVYEVDGRWWLLRTGFKGDAYGRALIRRRLGS